MSGIIEGYETLGQTLATFSQRILEPEILIPGSLGIGAFIVASIVVALDGDRGRHVERAVSALTPAFIVLLPLLFGVWLANGGDDTLKSFAPDASGENTLVGLLLGLVKLILVFIIVILFLLFPVVMVVSVAVIGFSLVRASPDLIMILFLALAPAGRGLGTVLHLPFRVLRSLVYFFTRPPAIREVKRVTQAKDARPEDIAQAHRAIKDEFNRVNNATKKEISDFTIAAFAYHYHKFADTLSAKRARVLAAYNRAVARTATETRRHIEQSHKCSRSKHEEVD